jgi:Tfp pilus assembly protein PilX
MNRRIGRQRGFLGLVAILIALLIVAWLAMDALKQYGVLSGTASPSKAAPAAERVRGAGAGVTEAAPDVTTATSAPMDALSKARGLEGAVREQAAENARRIDEGTK